MGGYDPEPTVSLLSGSLTIPRTKRASDSARGVVPSLPLVVVNIIVIEHGGNWSIGDAAIREQFRR